MLKLEIISIIATGIHLPPFRDKLLRVKDVLYTETATKEANKRQKIMIDFLYNFFEETNEKEWLKFLDDFLIEK